MTTPEPLIQIKNLSIIRQKRTILRDISLDILPHDFLTIIGPNGAGKSMLMQCIMGLIDPDHGTINRKSGLTLGYVPQQIAFNTKIPISTEGFLRLSRIPDNSIYERVIHQTQTEPLLHYPLQQLSGGEMQRVLLARALMRQPDLLILDEPAQHLDVNGQLALYALLDEVYEQQQCAMVMVSHDLHLVMASTRQVICLYEHICCAGKPQTVAKDPEFIQLFGQEVAAQMAVYTHHHDHTHEQLSLPYE